MSDYLVPPKPKADKKVGRSASKSGSPKGGGQHSVSGAMGKHQKTGSGSDSGASKGGY